MLDGDELERIVRQHQPDIIVPEIEAIRTEKLLQFERQGIQITPSANAVHLTMNRDAIRDLAANELRLMTAKFAYASSCAELQTLSEQIGFPNVVKPVMSSSGKGQSVVRARGGVEAAWNYAVQGGRGDKAKVIVEEFIHFDFEITLLTIKQKRGPTLFVRPIGHRQERGDYQESWLPCKMSAAQLAQAQKMAKKVTDRLGGAGLFGVEFFVAKKTVYFSELSPRPHDTGLVTLVGQSLSEFDLHLRAILALPIPEISYYGAAASAVILADRESEQFQVSSLESALKVKGTEVRWFGKPSTRPFRRMGVALAQGKTVEEARRRARQCASRVKIVYDR
jgi:phosphoribosylglycinamide formyltransferase 2